MITIYTTNSCASCKKAKNWLDENKIKYNEINMFKTPITKEDIMNILQNSENGFEDIISTRSKIIQENNLDIEEMSYNDLVNFIIKNPSVLKRPIIIDDRRFQVGYDDDEITAFRPRELRDYISNCTCDDTNEKCEYINALKEDLSK